MTESQIAQYMGWLPKNGYPTFKNYADLHRWSVDHLEDFWESIWKWSHLRHQTPYKKVLEKREMPGAKWFTGARLNFAENLLQFALEGDSKKSALIAVSESRPEINLTYGQLLEEVRRCASAFRSAGVKKGDRVAGIVSNIPEAIIAMLATTSLGAIWSSCSPDFGFQGILDRFGQIEPTILISVDGYVYNGKKFGITDRIAEVIYAIPSIRKVLVISQIGASLDRLGAKVEAWSNALKKSAKESLRFESVPFDHPVYILYSSGTTGVPKCIVHGGGGTLLQHTKELRLHTDVNIGDRFFYFTTCGWMMWNWLVSGLIVGAELVLFDGSPSHPSLDRLWKLAEEKKITIFGTSAKFIGSMRGSGMEPGKKHDLSSIRTILSTGSPLSPEDFDWVYNHIGKDIRISSISGGTDIVSCFVLGNPLLPVVRGEIQCKGLGMDVAAFDEKGREVIDQKGELVCRKPAPSMPVSFWNDPDGKKYKEAYFNIYPGIWRHGDYVLFNKGGGAIIYGRSDATLNPGGVRIGTAEIYRQIETMDEVADSLAVGMPVKGDEEVILFVVLKPGVDLTKKLEKSIRDRIRQNTTPRHVPKKIMAVAEIPYTISGKKVEIAVAKILRGEEVQNRDALSNPKSLDQFRAFFNKS